MGTQNNGDLEQPIRYIRTCLMNPYFNFYTPIPGPKTLGEYETLNAILEKGAWAVLICEVV